MIGLQANAFYPELEFVKVGGGFLRWQLGDDGPGHYIAELAVALPASFEMEAAEKLKMMI